METNQAKEAIKTMRSPLTILEGNPQLIPNQQSNEVGIRVSSMVMDMGKKHTTMKIIMTTMETRKNITLHHLKVIIMNQARLREINTLLTIKKRNQGNNNLIREVLHTKAEIM